MVTSASSIEDGGHDAEYDYCCTPCADDKLNAKAQFYCRNCLKLFCDGCVKYHNKLIKGHQVLGMEQVARWGKVKSETHTITCEKHSEYEAEMYCGDHDLVCCLNCISVHHRACKQVNHVSKLAKGIRENSEFKSFISFATSIQKSLRNTQDKRSKNIHLLKTARNKILSSFQVIRKSFNQFIDNLENESTTKMDRLLSILHRKIQSESNTCADIENEIQGVLDNIKDIENQCDDYVFQCLKKYEEKLATAEKLLSKMKDEDYQLKFTPNDQIQTCLSSLQNLGKFDITPESLALDYVYTVDNLQTYNVRTEGDTKTCFITGMCQLAKGQVAVVDSYNKRVKLLSFPHYSVIDELDLPPCPQDICNYTGKEFVVTVSSLLHNNLTRSELHFINVSTEGLKQIMNIKLDDECGAVACHKCKLYMSSKTTVYEYSLSGQKLRKIYENTSCEGVTVCSIVVSDCGNNVYITNFTQNLLLGVNKSNLQQPTLRLTDQELQKPTGVCLAENDAVIVCGRDSNTVIQVDSKIRNRMTTLAKLPDGTFPVSLCYHRLSEQLLIGQRENDNLIVLQLR